MTPTTDTGFESLSQAIEGAESALQNFCKALAKQMPALALEDIEPQVDWANAPLGITAWLHTAQRDLDTRFTDGVFYLGLGLRATGQALINWSDSGFDA
jgi:hypothetical protein